MVAMFHLSVDRSLELHLLEAHHAPLLFALTEKNRAHLRRWLPWLDSNTTQEDTRRFIDQARERYASRESLEMGIWHQGFLVGVVGFHEFDWPSRRGSMGYWLDAQAQGKGLMTRSCRALIEHAFAELGLNRVEIRCAPDNLRSRAIPERLGFRQEGWLRQAEWLYDRFVDHLVYGLLVQDWQARR
jgi:ribosomal-protein-serine acetyltransferase